MTFEDEVRTALAAEARRCPVPPVPGRALERRGQARRLRRTTALGSAAVTLAAAPTAVIVLQGGDLGVWSSDMGGTASSTGTTVTTGTTGTATPTAPPTSPVRVAEPGERIRISPNQTISLDRSGYCTHEYDPRSRDEFDNCKSMVDGNAGPGPGGVGSIGLGGGWDDGTRRNYYIGTYFGSETPERIVVSTDQGELTATIVTLPSRPDWVVFYAEGPRLESEPVRTAPPLLPGATAYDENGKVLAELARHEA